MNEAYRAQVRLMLDLLPLVAEETAFALKGGTAINFFVRDMPRLPFAHSMLTALRHPASAGQQRRLSGHGQPLTDPSVRVFRLPDWP